ncbi:helix-turn-helix domain-containing protein [Rhodococcus sp. WB9]|uniref:IclR family transcriptional regulator n=1 Tax=Rhodococcus sp. WB9 TaxID=2594007 RepID=UPI001184C7DA|nr:helix-turn-helix domain-containing protein [Rhodococcus sp. WB9]QDQ89505.1 helix-turn-helix domain-containing protein [Rhodococcus sp. WB9]
MARNSPQTERIVMLTELLADEPETPRSLADIARHLGVAKATCYPMVVALTEAGWLIRHPTRKTYRLGPALIPIGRAATTATDVVDLARSVMHELADASDMASIAFVQSGNDVVVAEVVQPVGGRRGTLGLRLGDKVLLAPPIGSGIAAWYPPEQREDWYALGGQNLGVEVDVLRATYEPALALVRERGYAMECMEQQQHSLADAVSELRGRGVGGHRSTVALREARTLLSADAVVGDIDPEGSYQPLSINAAAFDRDGEPAVVLCVADASRPMSGVRTTEIGEMVRDAAARVTAAMHGRHP